MTDLAKAWIGIFGAMGFMIGVILTNGVWMVIFLLLYAACLYAVQYWTRD